LTQLPDIQKAIQEFTTGHDWSQDPDSAAGFSICSHYGPWIASLNLSTQEIQELTAFSVLQTRQESDNVVDVGALLNRADLPEGWKEAYSWGMSPPVNEKFVYIVKSALYGEIERRLFHTSTKTAAETLALAYLVEAAIEIEGAWINRTNAINYVPMGHLEDWWPQYMSFINSSLSASDLAALSETAGSTTETEALSSVTPPERLATLYAKWSTVVAANPRLPPELVNREMEKDWNLLFHPNAEREKSWSVIQQILESGDYEDLGACMAEFWDMKDGNWFEFSRFAVDSSQAMWLKKKIFEWCNENLDEDEREEALDLMALEAP
jgi:hypothetical protein